MLGAVAVFGVEVAPTSVVINGQVHTDNYSYKNKVWYGQHWFDWHGYCFQISFFPYFWWKNCQSTIKDLMLLSVDIFRSLSASLKKRIPV